MATIRSLELRLLCCTLPLSDHPQAPPTPSALSISPHPLHSLVEGLIESIESGNYIEALSSAAARAVFSLRSQSLDLFVDSAVSAQLFYAELLPEFVNSFVVHDSDGDEVDMCYRGLVVIAISVAALLAFTQVNITGPFQKLPSMPLTSLTLGKEDEEGESGVWIEWEGWATREVISAGSDLCGKFSNLQYIVFAKILLIKVKDLLSEGNISSTEHELKSISWWLARMLLLQQRLLDDRSSSLFDLLQVYTHEFVDHFDTTEKLRKYWSYELLEEDASTIASLLHLEAGIMELTYGRTDSSRQHFEFAILSSGLDFSVSGALAFRTLYQVELKAQLHLVARTNSSDAGALLSPEFQNDHSTNTEVSFHQHPPETREASDVLMAPRFVEDDKNTETNAQGAQSNGIASIQLKAVHQAVILAQCLSIERSVRIDDLEMWKMAPYIEAIDAQQSSHFIIKYLSDILRIRWESTRSRTKQRSLLMMDKLVEGIYEASPGITQRMYCCFAVNVPTIPALRKEYGDLLVSCGLVGEAVKVYEDLELWDNLIYCYCLLKKKASAVELIKKRLSESPCDPRLWCSLGDVTNDDACYKKALEVSGNKSARAQRSLARNAYSRGDYETSKVLWERAMALNSLYPDGWFALGAAALKARDVDRALDGFTRAVQLDPDNGEAWNNIACLHMVTKKNKEAFVAFKEALKFKRNSWQMWENYSYVAADVGNFSQALDAVQKVLDMTNNKRYDAEFLDRMTREIEERASTGNQPPISSSGSDNADPSCANSDLNENHELITAVTDVARMRETEHLIQLLGKIFRQIVQSGGSAEIWGLHARWHRLQGDLTMCSEALLKQVRSYQGSDLWRDRERFMKFAHASLELCKVYRELARYDTAKMHLRNTIKQASNLSDIQEYKDLVACLDEVEKALQAQSLSAA